MATAQMCGRLDLISIPRTVLLALLLGGCSALSPAGPEHPAELSRPGKLDADESTASLRAAEIERDLHAKGLVVTDDPELAAYLDAVGKKLAPGARYRFGILRDPGVNAVGLPNGAIYVLAGTLARLENEAQLAFLLGHEIAHVEGRHGVSAIRDLKTKTVAAKLGDLLLGGIATPVIRHALATSIASYGREQEEEADREALRRLVAAGYPAEEAERFFAVTRDGDPAEWRSPYPLHPETAERMRLLRELASGLGAAPAAATNNPDGYRKATRRIARRSIEWALADRLYGRAADDAERELARGESDPRFLALLGEAHRMTADDPEGAALEAGLRRSLPPDDALVASYRARAVDERGRARDLFRRALRAEPGLTTAHRGLGLVAHAEGDLPTARTELGLYLRDPGPLPDRIFVQRMLEEGNP